MLLLRDSTGHYHEGSCEIESSKLNMFYPIRVGEDPR